MSFYYLPHADAVSESSAHDGVYLKNLPLPTLAGSGHIGHIRALVSEHYPLMPPEQQERITHQVLSFFTEILREDMVLVRGAQAGTLDCYEITGAYHYFKDAAGQVRHGYPATLRKSLPAAPFAGLTPLARDWTACITIEDDKQQFAIKEALRTGYKFSPFWIKVGALVLLVCNLIIMGTRYWNYYQGKL